MSESAPASEPEGTGGEPEVLTADVLIYDAGGALAGELRGYLVKRATRSALLAAVEGVQELLYEVAWRDRALQPTMLSAGFLRSPATMMAESRSFTDFLAEEGVAARDRAALIADQERVAAGYALATLAKLGWQRPAGAVIDADELRQELQVEADHARLFRRLLELLSRAGVLSEQDGGFVVVTGIGDSLPRSVPPDPERFAVGMSERYPHAVHEIALFRRCAGALPDVLRGREDPLGLLFGEVEPNAADLYRKAAVWRAANRMLGDAVAALAADVPEGRRLRVLEVGAGTGSATACALPALPDGRFDYVYTDISAGFFAAAEAQFADSGASIAYRVLDIERDPVEQGFDAHGYDLVIAANVLHATRSLDQTLNHCRQLLAPSGQLVALENQRARAWMDLVFGQLDGWWRFADRYRPHHALASGRPCGGGRSPTRASGRSRFWAWMSRTRTCCPIAG